VWGGPNAQALGVVLVRGLLGGSGYAIDCQVSEPSARLWAVVSAGGSAAEVNGVVFANGRGYIGGVPLFAGVNSVAVYAQDQQPGPSPNAVAPPPVWPPTPPVNRQEVLLRPSQDAALVIPQG
jgi:hypothetical protein